MMKQRRLTYFAENKWELEAFYDENDKRLKSLQVIKDSEGILRVKTRIFFREDHRDFRLPIILPSDHPVCHDSHKEDFPDRAPDGLPLPLPKNLTVENPTCSRRWILRLSFRMKLLNPVLPDGTEKLEPSDPVMDDCWRHVQRL
ncbi:hypothetical protein HNY73_004989 [Argiope bruennichi]|uniref:Uncharacterized protein n=1 Tax=Argiope bruennichi TaxID=94029 RepID=A0A8T0FVD4_ARGBR|nr:hypothetical protein HNY73_004989 [Argiope bruennichi]